MEKHGLNSGACDSCIVIN